jgi:alkylation response protein AidB-like acyl-CoA dehydrogenase
MVEVISEKVGSAHLGTVAPPQSGGLEGDGPACVLADLRAWLAENWDPGLSLAAWRARFVASGWAAPTWPTRWHGRELPAWADDLVRDELGAQGIVGAPPGLGTALAGPSILQHGPDVLRERFLSRILTGQDSWCQLFSEPGAGSDLAGLITRAELDGDEWVVSGQKVWNSNAQRSDFGMLLARTDWDMPKHQGITFFAISMKQPGVIVRPLREMNDETTFNEVFLSDARIPRECVIGRVGGGWAAAATTLAYERGFGVTETPSYHGCQGEMRRDADQEAREHLPGLDSWSRRGGRVDLLIEQARRFGRDQDPVVRQEIARVLALHRVSQWTEARAQAAQALGRPPGSEGSIGKLAASQVARAASGLHARIMGPGATLTGPEAPDAGLIADIVLSVPAQSIAGGTDEIQKNILAEKYLGLPRDPSSDHKSPFRATRSHV